MPIETTHSQTVEHASQARPRRTRNVLVVLTASIGASWLLNNWLFFYMAIVLLMLFALDSFASNRGEAPLTASD